MVNSTRILQTQLPRHFLGRHNKNIKLAYIQMTPVGQGAVPEFREHLAREKKSLEDMFSELERNA
jgi:hypothetical protein